MFVDSATITCRAGKGGAGHVSFRREKFEPKGGPSGGDGGRGGDVIIRADEGLNTLLDFRGRPDWEAQSGESGRKKQQHGADGQHLVIRVPPGTLVFDHSSGEQLADLGPRDEFVAARGGHGGFGNEHYKSATNQTPTYAHPGQQGEERTVRLELKLLADVGLLGLPNAGKSTLLKALTRANPKIADYPFTTLSPQLGVAELDPKRRIVIADIPGLIEGASDGAGLGLEFLRHIERTKVLVHLLDVMPPDGSDPATNYRTIRKELEQYAAPLAEREEIICLNKLDLLENDAARAEAIGSLRSSLKLGREVRVLPLSGATGIGTRSLLEALWPLIQTAPRPRPVERASREPLSRPQPATVATAAKPKAAAKKPAVRGTVAKSAKGTNRAAPTPLAKKPPAGKAAKRSTATKTAAKKSSKAARSAPGTRAKSARTPATRTSLARRAAAKAAKPSARRASR